MTISSVASAPDGAPLAMSTLRTLQVRAPAMPSKVNRGSWLATCTGSSLPTSATLATACGSEKVAPPSSERAIILVGCLRVVVLEPEDVHDAVALGAQRAAAGTSERGWGSTGD